MYIMCYQSGYGTAAPGITRYRCRHRLFRFIPAIQEPKFSVCVVLFLVAVAMGGVAAAIFFWPYMPNPVIQVGAWCCWCGVEKQTWSNI